MTEAALTGNRNHRMTKNQKAAFLRDLTKISEKHRITLGWDYQGVGVFDFDSRDSGGRYRNHDGFVTWFDGPSLNSLVQKKKLDLQLKRFKRSPEYLQQKKEEKDAIAAVEKMIAEKGLRPFEVRRINRSIKSPPHCR